MLTIEVLLSFSFDILSLPLTTVRGCLDFDIFSL
jgi:hypothetical protein